MSRTVPTGSAKARPPAPPHGRTRRPPDVYDTGGTAADGRAAGWLEDRTVPSFLRAIAAVEHPRGPVLYICIPAYNEAQTIGVLLWRIRKVFQEYSREYEVLVYDDGSTDTTAETLEPYARRHAAHGARRP